MGYHTKIESSVLNWSWLTVLNFWYDIVKDVFFWRLHGLFSADTRYQVINICKSLYLGSYLAVIWADIKVQKGGKGREKIRVKIKSTINRNYSSHRKKIKTDSPFKTHRLKTYVLLRALITSEPGRRRREFGPISSTFPIPTLMYASARVSLKPVTLCI